MNARKLRMLTLVLVLASLGLLALALPFSRNGRLHAQDARPNILLIITDDQRYDTMDYMPLTKARIFDQGVVFTNAFVSTPLCCPSRSNILTGMYSRHTGVHVNDDILTVTTFVEHLHDAGYTTALVGKYLNSYHGGPPPEFDYWVEGSDYVDPTLNVNGIPTKHTGYGTYILRDYALTFTAQVTQAGNPFLLIFAPHAPHEPIIPAPGDENLYPDLAPYRPPSHNEADVSDKPAWVQAQPLWGDAKIANVDETRRRQLQTLHAVGVSIDDLLNALQAQNRLDNTFILFMSDNGYLLGEHRIKGKNNYYEESIRVPFAVRYPPLIDAPRVEDRVVANIDIAPTLYALAGIPDPPGVDGQSLVPLLQNADTWREDLLLEGWVIPFVGVHTEDWVYVELPGDIPELYNLAADPYQLQNLSQDPTYADILEEMRYRLRRLTGELVPTSVYLPTLLRNP